MIGIISYAYLLSSLNLTLGHIFETADAFALKRLSWSENAKLSIFICSVGHTR